MPFVVFFHIPRSAHLRSGHGSLHDRCQRKARNMEAARGGEAGRPGGGVRHAQRNPPHAGRPARSASSARGRDRAWCVNDLRWIKAAEPWP